MSRSGASGPPDPPPSAWSSIKTRFNAAIELDPEAREAYLDRLAQSDPELAARLRELLQAHEESDDFITPPRFGSLSDVLAGRDTGDDATPEDLSGMRLGAYQLDALAGRGGMGDVYRASRADGRFEMDCAVKVLRRGLDTDELLRRFRREGRALAALDHPGVARLVDAGATPDGRPYFVMEFVSGRPIHRWCEENTLSTRRRVELFQQVCDAVQHAHAHLIVHRDLKPANILVTDDGTPKLLDFGIAKLLDHDEPVVTQQGEELRWMTPQYASPEQVAGEPVSTATDVYALGLVLYELLSGAPAYRFETTSRLEAERVIREVDPRPPSQVLTGARSRSRAVSPDLDRITLHALRKEPARRYESAAALADDLGRYLDGRPVRARRPTATYLAKRYVQRHLWGVAAAVALLIVVIAGIVGVLHQARIAEAERASAVAARDSARELANFLDRMLSSADPSIGPGPETTVRSILTRASDELATDPPSDERVEASIESTLGRTYRSLGLYEDAQAHLARAVELNTSVLGADDRTTVDSENDLAILQYATGNYSEAERIWRRVLRHLERTEGRDHEHAAAILNNLGLIELRRNEPERAETLLEECLDIRRRRVGPRSLAVAETLNNLVGLHRMRGEGDLATRLATEVLEIRREVLDADHPSVAQALDNLAVAHLTNGDPERARPCVVESLRIYRSLYPEGHPDIAIALSNLAALEHGAGEHESEQAALAECHELRTRILGPDDLRTIGIAARLGQCLFEQQQLAEAEPWLRKAHDAFVRTDAEATDFAQTTTAMLARLYRRTGRPEKAAALSGS